MFGEEIWIPLLIGTILSAAATSYGVVTSAQNAAEQAELQRKQANLQADSLEQQAAQEEQDRIQASLLERRQNARKVASAEAAYSASGVTLQGTPTLSLVQMTEEQELDSIFADSASGYKRSLLLAQAENTRTFGIAGANLTQSAGITSSVGLGLSGASNVAMGAAQTAKEYKGSTGNSLSGLTKNANGVYIDHYKGK